MRNESFTTQDDSEIFSGRLFRVYSDSKFLDFVKSGTIATKDYPGPFKHYGIVCLNHDLDVVSVQEPEIQELS